MGQKIKKIWFWRKKKDGGRSIPQEGAVMNKDKWKDIAIRTAKTFAQVALGVIVAAIADPPEAWKPVLITAVTSGTCAAMNYIIQLLQKEESDDPADQQAGEG